jgi:hypothetical protein
MPQTFGLSESAVAVLRFCVKGYAMRVTDHSLEAFRELAAAGIMEPVPGADGNPETEYQFTEDGCARRQELLREAEERIERERFDAPDASNLSEAARELLRRRIAGDREVTDANRPLYRELVAARILYPVSTWVGGPESVFRFTRAGWERRQEWLSACADAPRTESDVVPLGPEEMRRGGPRFSSPVFAPRALRSRPFRACDAQVLFRGLLGRQMAKIPSPNVGGIV